MEAPNNVETFLNVEEGLKISLISVYNMLENKLLMGQKKACKTMTYKMVIEASVSWRAQTALSPL